MRILSFQKVTFTGYRDPFMQDKYLRTFILEGKNGGILTKNRRLLENAGPNQRLLYVDRGKDKNSAKIHRTRSRNLGNGSRIQHTGTAGCQPYCIHLPSL